MMAMRVISKRWTTCTSFHTFDVCGDDPSTGESEDKGCFWGWDKYVLLLPTVYTLPLRMYLPAVFPRAASHPYSFTLKAPSHIVMVSFRVLSNSSSFDGSQS